MAERLFSEFLAEHSRGHTDLNLTTELRDAAKAVQKHNRKAEITVKIALSPSKGMTLIAVSSTSKLPAEDPDQMLYFTDDDGNPVVDNPRQMSLPLRQPEGVTSG